MNNFSVYGRSKPLPYKQKTPDFYYEIGGFVFLRDYSLLSDNRGSRSHNRDRGRIRVF